MDKIEQLLDRKLVEMEKEGVIIDYLLYLLASDFTKDLDAIEFLKHEATERHKIYKKNIKKLRKERDHLLEEFYENYEGECTVCGCDCDPDMSFHYENEEDGIMTICSYCTSKGQVE